MKKIICILLCIAMCCFVLVGCADETIGADLDLEDYQYVPEVREAVELDFYIIVGEGTTDHAISTVERMINSRLADLYNTTLDIHYVTESEYVDTVVAAASASGEDRADIVLIAGYDMFNTLYSNQSLVNLNAFYSSKEFGKLATNRMILSPLLQASVVQEQVGGKTVSVKYVVPNNHVVGSYEYIMVHRKMAEFLGYTLDDIDLMTSMDSEVLLALQQRVIDESTALTEAGYNPDECVVHVAEAGYSLRNDYIANGYICNVASAPVVDAEEAHISSFGIVKREGDDGSGKYTEHYTRCMEVIYAINTDDGVRNLLQYGVENTNYFVDEDNSTSDGITVTLSTDESSVYNMSIIYTGPLFNAYYCDALGWNAEVEAAGRAQNSDSSLFTSPVVGQ